MQIFTTSIQKLKLNLKLKSLIHIGRFAFKRVVEESSLSKKNVVWFQKSWF